MWQHKVLCLAALLRPCHIEVDLSKEGSLLLHALPVRNRDVVPLQSLATSWYETKRTPEDLPWSSTMAATPGQALQWLELVPTAYSVTCSQKYINDRCQLSAPWSSCQGRERTWGQQALAFYEMGQKTKNVKNTLVGGTRDRKEGTGEHCQKTVKLMWHINQFAQPA